MTEFYVGLHSIQDVREFVSAASLTPVDIDVISGRYTIDAKSVLGLFSLDLEAPVLVRVYGSDDDGKTFRQGVEKLIVEPSTEQ
jgi:phosphotransferase system HPr-like phosphotransfer protein